MNLTLIAAIGKNGELGKNNTLIWRFKEDMKFFKENTIGKKIIMGRKTLESLPHLLPFREHLVLTKQNIKIDGVKIFNSKESLLTYLQNYDEEIMVIGGASIYNDFINDANKLLLTEIEAEDKEADVYFPTFDKDKYEKRELSEKEENKIKFKHIEYKRKGISI